MHALALIAWATLAGSTALSSTTDDELDATDRDALSLFAGSPVSDNALSPADFNHDGVIDLFDFIDFANAFALSDDRADIDQNGVVSDGDASDFACLWATAP